MQYPQYQAQGWPIGSGIVESGNKVVMQARLKGPGMHWAPEHVNPMLALRTSACNDRWEETCEHIHVHLHREKLARRTLRQQHRYDQLLRSVQLCVLFWRGRLPKPQPLLSLSSLLLPNLLELHAPRLPTPGVDASSRKSDGHPSGIYTFDRWEHSVLSSKHLFKQLTTRIVMQP